MASSTARTQTHTPARFRSTRSRVEIARAKARALRRATTRVERGLKPARYEDAVERGLEPPRNGVNDQTHRQPVPAAVRRRARDRHLVDRQSIGARSPIAGADLGREQALHP